MGSSTGNSPAPDGSVTHLLNRVVEGDRAAESLLLGQVYNELRRIAHRQMIRERPNHTLQPTALANEAYLRLVQAAPPKWAGRTHFFALAAKVMRNILVDCARERQRAKRGGGRQMVTLDSRVPQAGGSPVEVLALHEALERLAEFDPRAVEVVELHYFGGLTFREIAQHVGTSEKTAKRDWDLARAWLRRELSLRPGRR